MIWLILAIIIVAILLYLVIYNRNEVRKAEQAYPPTGSFVEVEGVRLHYVSKGRGKPIVFLHGGVLSTYDFEHVSELASHSYQTLVFDRPGYGYSERPLGLQATPDVQARLLRGALQALGIDRPIIVGHSMSGAVVLTYALNYADEIDGVILLGAAAYGGKAYPAGDGDWLSRMIHTPLIGHFLLHVLLVPLGRVIMNAMLTATFTPDPVPEEYRKITTALWLRPGQFKANREDILFFSPYVNSISARYQDIQLPVAIVIGDSDPFNKDVQSYRLHKEIEHSRLFELSNLGHMIPQIRPEAVVEIISILLQDIEKMHHFKSELSGTSS